MDNWFELVAVITGILQVVVTIAEWAAARRARRSKPGRPDHADGEPRAQDQRPHGRGHAEETEEPIVERRGDLGDIPGSRDGGSRLG